MKVLQLIDSLHIGGAERMAVTYANMLVSEVNGSYLCATREEGVLKDTLLKEVSYLFLDKKKTLDKKSIRTLTNFIKKESITHLHAHGTSYFLATLIKRRCPEIKLIWHNHHGASDQLAGFKLTILKWCSSYFDYVFTVNQDLKQWIIQTLKNSNVSYIPNFVNYGDMPADRQESKKTQSLKLAGIKSQRLIYLANLRAPKNHLFLCEAFAQVIRVMPAASLHFVGNDFEDLYSTEIKKFIESRELINHIFIHGGQARPDRYLNECAVGIIASSSEGLPVSLLEYGRAGLCVISTDVGQCGEVVGECGIIVPSNNVLAMEEAINGVLHNYEMRQDFAMKFQLRVKDQYGLESVKINILRIYNGLVSKN